MSSRSISTLALLKSSELETSPSECDIPFEFFDLLSALITSLSDVISAYDVLLLSRLELGPAWGDFTCTLFTDWTVLESLSEDSDSLMSGEFTLRACTISVNSLMVLALFFLRVPSFFFLRVPSFFFTTGSVAGFVVLS